MYIHPWIKKCSNMIWSTCNIFTIDFQLTPSWIKCSL
jgi:hypothetical protein